MCWTLNANDASAARAARKAARAAVASHTASADGLNAVELVIGELLSNAARHADGRVCLELALSEGQASISVHDTSSSFALDVRRPADDYSESGRGLFIVSELARRIAVVPLNGIGKCVTVTLDLPLRSDVEAGPPCMRPWLRHEDGICLRPRIVHYER